MKTAIYLRQSLDATGDELGIERQRGECERICRDRGYTVVETIIDNSVSASKHGRPGYARLVSLIERGAVEGVVILRIDRLMRLNDELEDLVRLVEATNVRVVTVEGDIDLGTPSGRLVARLLVSVARAEIETKSARHKLANEQSARAGKPHGSRRPYGYLSDLVTIYEPEAVVLREFAQRVIKGHGFNEIARWASSQGHLTSMGRPFLGVTIRNMLGKPRYAGIRTYNGVEYPAQWPAVFDPSTWERLKLELDVRKDKNVPKARKYLLTGIAHCVCGGTLNGSTKIDRPGRPKRRIYQCIKCRKVAINADALDWWVRECVLYRLDSPAMASLLAPGDDGEVRALIGQRTTQQARLDDLVDDYASGLLDKAQFARAKATAEAVLAETEEALDRATQKLTGVSLSAGQTLRDSWIKSDSNEWRRNVIGLIVKDIKVRGGVGKPFVNVDGKMMRFDSERVTIEWLSHE